MLTLEGFYDLHIHSAPAPFVRIGDSAEIARWCAEAGMAGIVSRVISKARSRRRIMPARSARTAIPDFKVFPALR